MGHSRVLSSQPVRFVVFEIGCIGVHSHVARPCRSPFTSPMPVYAGARPCYFDRLNHGRWARSCCFPVLLWQDYPRPRLTAVATYHIPCWGKNLALFSHSLMHTHVPGRVVFRKPAFHDSVSMLDIKN
ncbi:hypothetical protein GOBAR_AA22706 [Gossypium barbadense]|uniref:Uncharacterized protein n=1 Tax=Gossypium barbadense TaxID=3634 RepID=A0A2P5X3R9_GOSBA|nr:hypothetical protein GOBAR_AA22706 [Gossypium barbadense]